MQPCGGCGGPPSLPALPGTPGRAAHLASWGGRTVGANVKPYLRRGQGRVTCALQGERAGEAQRQAAAWRAPGARQPHCGRASDPSPHVRPHAVRALPHAVARGDVRVPLQLLVVHQGARPAAQVSSACGCWPLGTPLQALPAAVASAWPPVLPSGTARHHSIHHLQPPLRQRTTTTISESASSDSPPASSQGASGLEASMRCTTSCRAGQAGKAGAFLRSLISKQRMADTPATVGCRLRLGRRRTVGRRR